MRFLLLIFLSTKVMAQNLTLIWCPPTNMPAASFGYAMVQMDANHILQNEWACSTTNFVTPAVPAGISYWKVAQNPINAWANGSLMLFSGELELSCIPNAVITATGTNSLIQSSTDLGTNWTTIGTNTVIVPLSKAQQFFTSKNQKSTIAISNAMRVISISPP